MIQTIYTTGCGMILTTGSSQSYAVFSIGFSCNSGGMNIIQEFSLNADFYPSSGKAVNDGLWHTVLITYDGTTLNIYVDGRLDNTATNWNGGGSTAALASTVNTLGNSGNYLGVGKDGSSATWIGKLKNVIFYDYVITKLYALANSYQSAGSIIYNSGNYQLYRINLKTPITANYLNIYLV